MRTTIEISDARVKKARRLAAREKTSLRALLEEGPRKVLDDHSFYTPSGARTLVAATVMLST